MDSITEEIKNRLDIVNVIQDYIRLQKSGKDYKALCPFHNEKTPSFFVSPEKQIWHCFGGCSEGGDIFTFVMKIEGVEFPDALKTLAAKAGVVLKRQDPRLISRRSRLYEIAENACRFFEKQLEESGAGKKVIEYLLARGIGKESIKNFRLGWAPNTWHSLEEFLTNRGYARQEIVDAGLAIASRQPSAISHQQYHDRFRSRVMFPIFDLSGRIIGFSGRIFEQDSAGGKLKADSGQQIAALAQPTAAIAKYINTPSTLIYDKSRALYGFDKAKLAIRKSDKCVLVEGNTDVMMSHQAGAENTVATSGTSLTSQHLFLIKRYTDNLVFCFDMDLAGENATKKGIDLALEMGFNVKVVRLPQGKDPADFIKLKSQEWPKQLDNAKNVMEFYFDSVFSKYGRIDIEAKKNIAAALLPLIKRVSNKIEQTHWLQHLSLKLGVDERTLSEMMNKLADSARTAALADGGGDAGRIAPKTREEILEENLLALIIKSPEILSGIYGKINSKFIKTAHLAPFFQEMMKKSDNGKISESDIKKITGQKFNFLFLKAEHYFPPEIDCLEEAENCVRELKIHRLREKLSRLSMKIKQAEQEKNKKFLPELIQKFTSYSKKFSELQ